MGYHNKDHKYRRVVSKYKLARIYENNLDKAGVAYRIIGGETQTSSVACKIGPIIYAWFAKKENEGLKEDICIRYRVDEKELDLIAFSHYNSPIKSFFDLMKINPEKCNEVVF